MGDIKKAKKTMSELRSREPLNPSPCYSLGFLFAYEGDLKKAEHYYLKGFEATKNATPEYIFHLSEFIEAVLDQVDVKKHFHLHYVLGLIHKELIDSQSAKAHFEKYLTFVSNRPEMEEWSEKAGKHISDIL